MLAYVCAKYKRNVTLSVFALSTNGAATEVHRRMHITIAHNALYACIRCTTNIKET